MAEARPEPSPAVRRARRQRHVPQPVPRQRVPLRVPVKMGRLAHRTVWFSYLVRVQGRRCRLPWGRR